MKKLDLNAYGVSEMSETQTREVNGGGEWKLWEATFCFCIAGMLGVVFYTVGTLQ